MKNIKQDQQPPSLLDEMTKNVSPIRPPAPALISRRTLSSIRPRWRAAAPSEGGERYADEKDLGLQDRHSLNFQLYLGLRKVVRAHDLGYALQKEDVLYCFNLCYDIFADARGLFNPEFSLSRYLLRGANCPKGMTEELHDIILRLKPLIVFIMLKADGSDAYDCLCTDLCDHMDASMLKFFDHCPAHLLPSDKQQAECKRYAKKTTRGLKQMQLFSSPAESERWAALLQDFFGEVILTPIDGSERNDVLKAMAWFLYFWDNDGLLSSKRPVRAAVRFLQQTGFPLGATDKTVANVLGRLIMKRSEDKTRARVEQFINKQKR